MGIEKRQRGREQGAEENEEVGEQGEKGNFVHCKAHPAPILLF
ncbi:hypothetical protein COO91_06587 [Nostoc flagelliforme CCNUN1]|uniref:Uncharacterized protein n=1 Tax=Nostoc flagelliforme CCNUN1 TaxID=2038116 RepID=A0A2K8SYV6_9NOSO|nr:hypothetical protein COO91_06587 [Nostoc flagelliforme CCNUN1]